PRGVRPAHRPLSRADRPRVTRARGRRDADRSRDGRHARIGGGERMSTLLARLPDQRHAKTAAAVLASIAVMAVIVAALGANPLEAASSLLRGALGSKFGLGETLTI